MPTIYGMALRDGEPVSGVEVKLLGEDGSTKQTVKSGDDGSFTIDAEAGVWGLQWIVAGSEPDEGQIEVEPGQDAEVELEIS